MSDQAGFELAALLALLVTAKRRLLQGANASPMTRRVRADQSRMRSKR